MKKHGIRGQLFQNDGMCLLIGEETERDKIRYLCDERNDQQMSLWCLPITNKGLTYRQLILSLPQPHPVDVAVLASRLILREDEAADLEGFQQRQRRIGDPRLARPPHPVIAPDPAAATAVVVVRATCAIPVWLAYS